jgi:hypothetical protein
VPEVANYRRKHQAGVGVHCQKQEGGTLKMCLDEEELAKAIFAILIPTLVATTILYILMMRLLPYERP